MHSAAVTLSVRASVLRASTHGVIELVSDMFRCLKISCIYILTLIDYSCMYLEYALGPLPTGSRVRLSFLAEGPSTATSLDASITALHEVTL
jgi:hypothetical protein